MRRLIVAGTVIAVALATVLPAHAAPPGDFQRVVVQLHEDVASPGAVAREYVQRFGGRQGAVYSHAIKGFAAELPATAVTALSQDPRVAVVEQDYVFTVFAQQPSTGVDRSDADLNPLPAIDGVDGRLDYVDVAILDTGVDIDHPDLNVRFGTDCRNGIFIASCSGSGDFNDYHGHGTHVAGIVGALDNDIGSVGVAPGVTIWVVKVLDDNGSGYLSWIIAGIDAVTAYADRIEVANMSLGCECSSTTLNNAITNSVAAGVVYVVAAGNSAKDASTFSPANHPDVVTVSALSDFDGDPGGLGAPTCRSDQDDTLADFSNYGPLVELAAPGVCIYSTYKDGGYTTMSGTSMASPHVAGLALLYIAHNGRDTDNNAVIDGADVFNIRADLVASGHPQASACGFSNEHAGQGSTEPLMFANATVVGGTGTCESSGTPSNTPPVADAGPDQTVTDTDANGSENVTLDGSGSSDSDGTLMSYEWTEGGTPLATGVNPTVTLAVGAHTITLTVTDDQDATASDQVVVTVEAAPTSNTPPVADAGLDQTVTDTDDNGSENVTLDGSGSSDSDGTLTSYEWTEGGTPLATGVNPTVTLAVGAHTITLTVTDDQDATASDQVVVTVEAAPPSVAATVHVADLDAESYKLSKGTWAAGVAITVHDGDDGFVAGAVVTGTFYQNGSFVLTRSCTTAPGSGTCFVESGVFPSNNGKASFVVDSVVLEGYAYDPVANHDPDGDSDGTTISISK